MLDPAHQGRSTPRAAAGSTRPRWKRRLMRAGLAIVGLVVAAELGSRWVLGLGDPPLYRLDPKMEYVLVPSRSYRRFGNEFRVNAYSMRADEFPEKKHTPDELRVLVIGDSIVNGGSRVDQRDLATEVLKRSLPDKLHRPVVVGNASAGSWGPPNELAWLEAFGTLDADVVLIVLNSPDQEDVPGQDYLGMAWPRDKPILALQELATNYGWKAVCRVMGWVPEPAKARTQTREQDIAQSHAALTAMIDKARAAGAKVAVVLWPKRTEVDAGGVLEPGWDALSGWAKDAGAPVYGADAPVRAAMAAGQPVYISGDIAHPDASGHRILAATLEQAVTDALKRPPGEPGVADGRP